MTDIGNDKKRVLTDLLRTYVKSSRRVTAMDWLPVATIAMESEDSWLTAVQDLDEGDQYLLINLLAKPESGPICDWLIRSLASRAEAIDNPQVQLNVYSEARKAFDRDIDRLTSLKQSFETESSIANNRRKRISEGFDAAAEILRLERDLVDMQAHEYDLDDEFEKVHALENAILEFQARKRIVENYDFKSETTRLQGLRTDIEESESQKKKLQTDIAAAIGERDAIESDLERLSREAADTSRALRRIQETVRSTMEQTEDDRRQAQSLEADNAAAEQESHRLKAEQERLTSRKQELDEVLRTQKATLQDLRVSAGTAGLDSIVGKLDELYAILPPDKADDRFSTTGRSKT